MRMYVHNMCRCTYLRMHNITYTCFSVTHYTALLTVPINFSYAQTKQPQTTIH